MSNSNKQLSESTDSNIVALGNPSQYQMIIEKAMSSSSDIDLDKMTKLMEMQERWEANEARKSFNNAMSEFSSSVPAIVKDKKGHNNNYASLSNIVDIVRPKMSDYGLSHIWSFHQKDTNTVTVSCTFNHKDGHSKTIDLTAGFDLSGNKSNIHGLGSTISYLERYTFKAMAGIAEKDDDGKMASGAAKEKPITKDQAMQITAFINENKLDMKAWLRWFGGFGANSIEEIPAKKFNQTMSSLKNSLVKT